ncbi:MAG TPA: hypothetical protein VGG83_19285 [Trebonia sp.]
MRIRHPLRASLTACLGLSGLALAAGCSVAPAGAAANSPEVGPVRTGAAAQEFAAFPVAARWNGLDNTDYVVAAGAKTGTKPHVFAVTARSSLVFWLNCIGAGTARLTSPAVNLKWGVPCGNGDDPQGITFRPPRATEGKLIKVLVTVPAGARWEVRIDEPRSAAA